MSDRDQSLVHALGISVAQMAEALDRSRQTVSRGFASGKDYLKPVDLAKALSVWRHSDASLYVLAKSQICETYPEVAQAILNAAEAGSSAAFSTDVAGEYWFLTGDLIGFRSELPACAKQLETLCSLASAQVKLFINERDLKSAHRFQVRFAYNDTQVIVCRNVSLMAAPSTLLRIGDDDKMDVFGVSDAGFVALSRKEGMRLRLAVERDIQTGDLDSMNTH